MKSTSGIVDAIGIGTGVVALLAVALVASGHDAGAALAAMWRGSLGSSYAFLSATLVRSIPLALTGTAIAIAFRAGVLNIGAEGQFLAGATAAAAISVRWGSAGVAILPVALVAGALCGALWAGIAAFLRGRFHVLEVISTIMLNFIALHAVGYLVRGPLQEATHIYPQTETFAVALRLPAIIRGTRLHLGFVIAVVVAAGAWFVLRGTAAGFRARATGLNPHAAFAAGLIHTGRVTAMVFLASGAIAGLAGAVEVHGVTYALYENISPGYGYTAIAVALLARLNPLFVLPSAMFFGALEAGAAAMQRDAGVPSVVVSVVEALVILLVVAADRVRERRLKLAAA